MDYTLPGSSIHGRKNTGVGCHALLQGIFPTQGSNPGLLPCRQILNQLSYNGSPRLLEWVAYPFSSGSSRPRNQTQVSCIAGGFFTNWAIREAWVSPANAGDTEMWVWSLGWENPLEEGMVTHCSILAWNLHEQRSLVGYSSWGHRELDTTEQLSTHTW